MALLFLLFLMLGFAASCSEAADASHAVEGFGCSFSAFDVEGFGCCLSEFARGGFLDLDSLWSVEALQRTPQEDLRFWLQGLHAWIVVWWLWLGFSSTVFCLMLKRLVSAAAGA